MAHKLAFVGFGGVGQALADIILDKKETLKEQMGTEPIIVAISDVMKGAVYHPDGLDIETLLKTVRETGSVEQYPNVPGLKTGMNSIETIQQTNADTIVEVTYTDVQTGQPAIDHCRMAFQNSKNVVTTNKGPIALAYHELSQLAADHHVFWGFEGTVMSGTPALRMPKTTLAGNEITEIKGILNGTTNYILCEMEAGLTYDEALSKAQELGYAEADPTSDVEGYDARYKTVILANYVMGAPLDVSDIKCQGITGLNQGDIETAQEQGEKWKLIARIRKEEGGIKASVQPERISADDQLAAVHGPVNAIIYECDLAGTIMLTGAGAGLQETGFSLLIDLINGVRDRSLAKT
ncbi:homoserine dehydrogenase [Tuberibacillus sp. Marseille-P3662]|uniref:homoserine dehydrogenase n=1 Tax=Tuberibacillus sp. Marseille-P3662 TaxID=1965358 RepID=UPI000A1CEDEC|nr:homoserine dehydrogenase [Tuberibacillus sp. Marseille-P3662]